MSEREEIMSLKEEYRPLSPWTYFGLTILYGIPIVGVVFLIIHAISNSNINRRNFARSYFCIYVLLLIVIIIFAATGALSSLFN